MGLRIQLESTKALSRRIFRGLSNTMERIQTASMLVIGNELLSGKFEERNVAVLAKELFALGIRFQRVEICPDEVEIIASDVSRLSGQYDHVFTSGGVGPTHDDVTMEAVADAFSCRISRNQELENALAQHFGERLLAEHLVMADIPEGAEILWSQGSQWPLVRLRNVFILPGLPEAFRLKMPMLREHITPGPPFVSKQVKVHSDEGSVAALLRRLVVAFPDVNIGSYPRWEAGSSYLIISFDGTDQDRVDEAARALLEHAPATGASG